MRSLSSPSLFCILLFPLSGCLSPPEAPLPPDAVVAATGARADPEVLVREALVLAALAPLDLGLDPATTSEDPDTAGWWRAAAIAWNPSVRAARRRLQTSRLAASAAGLPEPLSFGAEHVGFDEQERSTELMATIDLLGLLGTGRAAAAKSLASAEARSALGALEAALWAARFEVDLARADLATALVQEAGLRSLVEGADADFRRAILLEGKGWIPPSTFAAASAMLHRTRIKANDMVHDVAKKRAALAEATGLPPDSAVLARLSQKTLDTFDPGRAPALLPDAAALLEAHPGLRKLRLDYAVAEARVRAAAAESWPDLRLGPKITFGTESLLPGGILSLDLPLPGVAEKRMNLAISEREGAREALEDALVQRRNEVTWLREKLTRDVLNAANHAPVVDAATARAWQAARARFAVDPAMLDLWTMELERRAMGLEDAAAHRWHAIEAALMFEEACGRTRPASSEPSVRHGAKDGGGS